MDVQNIFMNPHGLIMENDHGDVKKKMVLKRD